MFYHSVRAIAGRSFGEPVGWIDDLDKSASIRVAEVPRRSTALLGDRKGTALATCTLTYSTDVARRAARTYFWRRFKTPLGVSFLFSLPVTAGFIWFIYSTEGANWFVGAFGLLIVMNLIIQGSYYFSLPKAFARRLSDPSLRTAEVETSSKGIRVLSGPNSALLPWKSFKHIWFYHDFVILAVRPPLMRFTFLPTDGMTPEVRLDLDAASEGRPIA